MTFVIILNESDLMDCIKLWLKPGDNLPEGVAEYQYLGSIVIQSSSACSIVAP